MERNIYKIGKELYITSDEEIKEDDYRMNVQRTYFKKSDKEGLEYYNKRNDVFKKIILTTDQDLISDNVQAIDKEFLEWFANNSSCEYIEVVRGFADGTNWGYNFLDYKIIIPKETPKQETLKEQINQYNSNGKKHGYWEEVWEFFLVTSKGHYENGIENGYWEFFYPNGNLFSKGNIVNGVQNGLWVDYYNNGKVSAIGNKKFGLADGEWIYYDENGDIKTIVNYEKGNVV